MTNGVAASLNFSIQSAAVQPRFMLSLSNVLLVTSSPVTVPSTNLAGLIVVNPIFITPSGGVGFVLAAPGARTNIVQASTDLVQWTNIGAIFPNTTALEFTDTNAVVFPRRFYRAIPLP